MEENQLIQQIVEGNTHAFRFLVKKYERLVFHIAAQLIEQQDDVEDICQEVFVKVYKNLPNFRHEAKLSTWIGTIAYRESIDFLRKKGLATEGLETLKADANVQKADTNHPEKIQAKAERKAMVKKLIDELPPVYRSVLMLYHIEELNYKEIEEITRLPEGTLKSYLHRARQLLKSRLLAQTAFVEEWL